MSFTSPKPLEPPPQELLGSTVLVVEDERPWRLILATDLTMLGYRVAMAEDAEQALALAGREQPAIAIIDLMLPEPVDGWALLAMLQAEGRSMPVIFYTADPSPPQSDDPDVVRTMSKSDDRADLYALLADTLVRRLHPQ